MTARVTVPIGDIAGTVREALRAALEARGIVLAYAPVSESRWPEQLHNEDLAYALHELGKVAARAVVLLDVDKLAPGEERGVVVMDVAG